MQAESLCSRTCNNRVEFWEPYFAFRRSLRLLVSTSAAPPTRKRQLGISMALLLPKYQFCVIFSVDTTSARLVGYTCTYAQCLTTTQLTPIVSFHIPRLQIGDMLALMLCCQKAGSCRPSAGLPKQREHTDMQAPQHLQGSIHQVVAASSTKISMALLGIVHRTQSTTSGNIFTWTPIGMQSVCLWYLSMG